MATRCTDSILLQHLIDLSHNLQLITNNQQLSKNLIDDITRHMRSQFGEQTFIKILFNGIKSLTQDEDLSPKMVIDKLESVSNYSSEILNAQTETTANNECKTAANNTLTEHMTECERNNQNALHFCSLPNAILHHISSYLTLKQSIQLNTLNYILFKVFSSIPKYFIQQLNKSHMSWFKSNNSYIINKCKSITNINFKYIKSFNINTLSLLSKFNALESLTVICNQQGNIENMKQLLDIIPYQSNLSELRFDGNLVNNSMPLATYVKRQDLYSEYMQKYGSILESLCINNYRLDFSHTLISILTYCKKLKQLSIEHDGVMYDPIGLAPSLFDNFMFFANNNIEYAKFVNYYSYGTTFEKFVVAIMHNVQSFHLLYFCNFGSRRFLAEYISKYCESTDPEFSVRRFAENIMQNEKHFKMVIEGDIYYKNENELCQLEELCIDIKFMNKFMLFWLDLIVLNATNLKKLSLMYDQNEFYNPFHIKTFIGLCLKKLECLKFGVMNRVLFEMFVSVFKSEYNVETINKIKYIDLTVNFENGGSEFNFKEELIGLMKLMCLHGIDWKIGIKFRDVIDEEIRNEILDKILYQNWPNYNQYDQKQKYFENIRYVDGGGRQVSDELKVGIIRNQSFTVHFKHCDSCC